MMNTSFAPKCRRPCSALISFVAMVEVGLRSSIQTLGCWSGKLPGCVAELQSYIDCVPGPSEVTEDVVRQSFRIRPWTRSGSGALLS
jgi:hypothetical protein